MQQRCLLQLVEEEECEFSQKRNGLTELHLST